MKKSVLYVGLSCCALGVCLMIAGFFLEDALGGLLFGLASGMTGVGIGNIVRWRAITGDSQSDYAKHMRQTDIEQRDERNRMLRDRSGYVVMQAMLILFCLLYLVMIALNVTGAWSPMGRYLSWVCLGLFLIVWVVYGAAFHYFSKRM